MDVETITSCSANIAHVAGISNYIYKTSGNSGRALGIATTLQ